MSLTDLVDIVSASGTSKATKVAVVKNRTKYDPRFDFYKPFREHLVHLHSCDGTKDQVKDVLTELSDEKKLAAYPDLVKGYVNWWGRKQMKWFDPPSGTYSVSEIDVRVNPELGLLVNDVPHVIKLFLKSGKLTKTHTDLVLHLMETCLRSNLEGNTVLCILDVRNAKLTQLTTVNPRVLAMVHAELAYIAAIWPEL